MKGATRDLVFGAFLPCVPVIVVVSVLLSLIFKNRVEIDPGFPIFQTPETSNLSNSVNWNLTLQEQAKRGFGSAYYVRYNPATLAAVASWSSKIIPLLTGTSMSVVAFFAGHRILESTRLNRPNDLPTPHQTSILIKLLTGSGPKALYDALKYRWQHKERFVRPIPLALAALVSVLLLR